MLSIISRPPRAQRLEYALATALPSLLGSGVFAVAFVHVHDTARWAGQPEWASWLIATTGELMAIAAIVEIRARRRDGGSLFWPVLVLVASVIFSGACNLTAAYGLQSDPGHWTPIMALWPVIAFALVAGLKATRRAVSAPAVLLDEVAPVPATDEPITAGTIVESAPVPTPLTAPEQAPTSAPMTSTASTTRATRKPSTARAGKPVTSKKTAFAAYIAGVPAEDTRTDAELIRTYAPMVGLHANTARRYLADIRRAAQADGADLDVVTAQDTAHETDATDVLVGVAA